MTKLKRSEVPKLDLPPMPDQAVVEEREILRSEGIGSALEAMGRQLEGSDGKRYCASFAVHIYKVERLGVKREHIFAVHSTDLRQLSEQGALEGIKELARAIMQRFGRKPPSKTTDGKVHTTESKR